MITSSPFVNDVADPETYEHATLKNPASSVALVIVKIAKSVESALFEMRKWPFIGLVESSIVRR